MHRESSTIKLPNRSRPQQALTFQRATLTLVVIDATTLNWFNRVNYGLFKRTDLKVVTTIGAFNLAASIALRLKRPGWLGLNRTRSLNRHRSKREKRNSTAADVGATVELTPGGESGIEEPGAQEGRAGEAAQVGWLGRLSGRGRFLS
jgi:hypothetical protein